mmetsp:Transcript_18220/g.41517  ORF Transcript_18220/g.41517 Transcript_18220/m.41517 type:complete len:766 (-) Transcript_18220:87-2384(-)|eukprot:CAMPEP_0113310750 /NCGR_PEP_ID=MMETSP0010_2-20120614/8272_1 /TAXON_ID=216773 ORGANISM="Corethron hystrix, Strain 308" /NCGR_SAMPLE_ID=MMETSP0010_2 /ASSEMBLY_ACC=CAM_ASM_000155 /LENGTH=765 /DNA_ID=CAMNT_0000166271 /DNA_START=77 /DNA_END=2374 /DNA_ORIENTATION=- /assembly_acc=CAM_ASM_000155
MTPTNAYLSFYNLACAGGWLYVLLLTVVHLVTSLSDVDLSFSAAALKAAFASVFSSSGNLRDVLFYVQSAAAMEVVHAAVGLVRSPVAVTFMQVSSRIVAIFALFAGGAAVQAQFGAGLMIISWSFVEVPRYLFYLSALVSGDASKGTPYSLFWMRYSLFAVLYPSGITGEVLVFLAASKSEAFLTCFGDSETMRALMYYGIMSIPLIYTPGSPFMIMNMAANRKSAFKKRFAKPPPPLKGLVFPITGKKKGVTERSTTAAGKNVIAAALAASNPAKAERAKSERNWRFGYIKHIVGMVQEQCKAPDAALAVAEAGLEHMYSTFEFIAPDGSSCTFQKAMMMDNAEKFCTGFIKGQKPRGKNQLEIPYKGKMLQGDAIKAQVKKWVEYGTIEPDCGVAICKCVDNPQWLDLSNKYFVLLGAGSAMGPFRMLMALGANVVAIDLDRPGIWKGLIDVARNSPGTITFPMKKEQYSCKDDDAMYTSSGCNLFTETPMIKDWLVNLYVGKSFIVGSYAYLDGALHVQVSLAMDSICKALTEKRANTSLVYLCTPTDCHLVPKEASLASENEYNNFSSKKVFCSALQLLSGGKFLIKNAKKSVKGKGGDFYYVNGLANQQGPNYALAKRLQHWRAIVAREKYGCIVSSNVAPATSTASVVHARTFAWAYGGMPFFKPYEIAEPDTSKAVMLALLMFDLNDASSAGNPNTKLENPNQLMQYGSFNGGAWRCAYTVDSIGEVSVLVYFMKVGAPYFVALTSVGVAAAIKFLF